MEEFIQLIEKIEQTKSTLEKTAFIHDYFSKSSPEDSVWALFFLSGNKLKRVIGPSKLWEWCLEASELPDWLMEESYASVGDLAETIALLMGSKKTDVQKLPLNKWITEKIYPLASMENEDQKKEIINFWKELSPQMIFILNKILTGSLRIGVSHLITLNALSKVLKIPKETLSHRLMGSWTPTAEFFESLKGAEQEGNLNPYPFYLASPLQDSLESLGNPEEWIAEWKWDGIRAQAVNRKEIAIWSRGNELISHQFPELMEAFKKLPQGSVLDGEILAYRDGTPLVFNELQKRLGRKKLSQNLINEVPTVFMIYDILEFEGQDLRKKPLQERRSLFENWELDPKIVVSPIIQFSHWEEIAQKRNEAATNNTEGVMLKKKDSPYLVGRRRGKWWKYKIDPKTIDAVLIYAQPGQGWRANLYTDYTFGVWNDLELVPIAKAYSGLSMEEIQQLDRWIRKNTLEKFGPVRRVKPEQVFEIAFEGIQISSRHKSGVAFRFPRILRWRHDKPVEECDTLENIKEEFLKWKDPL